MAKYDIIFWDWNGTLLDDTTTSVASIAPSLIKRNLPVPTVDQYRKLFKFPVIDYYKELGFNFSDEPFEIMANEYTAEYEKRKYEPSLFKEVKEVLAVIKSKNIKQYILTASEKNIVIESLEHYGISKYFDGIGGCDNTFAHGKISIGKSLIEQYNLSGNILMVGDTVHDSEVATSLNVDCVLIEGGHNSHSQLSKTNRQVISNRYDLYPIIFPELFEKQPSKMVIKKEADFDINASENEIHGFSEVNDFSTKYKSFYDDIKMTNKTEDW